MRRFSYCIVLACSCSPAWPDGEVPQIYDESGAKLDALPQVVRLHVAGLDALSATSFWLIEGSLGSGNEAKLRQGFTPDSVATHRLPLAVLPREGEWVLAPGQALGRGKKYTIAALGFGRVADLTIAEDGQDLLSRWGDGPVFSGGWLSYCAAAQPDRAWMLDAEEDAIGTRPPTSTADVQVGLHEGFFTDQCVRLRVDAEVGQVWIPPQQAGRWFVAPQSYLVEERAQLEPSPQNQSPRQVHDVEMPPDCEAEQCQRFSLGWVCACGAGIGVGLLGTAASGAALAASLSDERGEVARLLALAKSSGQELWWGPLEPESRYGVTLLAYQNAGTVPALGEMVLQTGPGEPKFVLNEVMADPFGPEPEGEWVEVVNAGNRGGSVVGLIFADESGGVTLPDVRLEPGQYGLLVRRDFAVDVGQPPAATTLPIWLDTLGANGLRNAGERIELRSSSGVVLSHIPALASGEGFSLARKEAWAPDRAESFGRHAAPGSSAGEQNRVEENSP